MRRILALYAAQNSAQPGYQFAEAKWLGDVIVRAGPQSIHHVILPIANTHHHDSGPRGNATNLPASLQPPHSRHLQIKQDQIKRPLPDGG